MTETEQLSDYLGALYELALEPSGWPCLLQRLLEWVGACAIVLLHRQQESASGAPCLIQYFAGARLEWAQIENGRDAPLIRWARQARTLETGALLALSEISGSAADESHGALTLVGASALGDLLIAVIERDPHGRSIELLMAREPVRGRWDVGARATLALLMPHLQRVLRLSGALPEKRREKTGPIERVLSAARPYAFTPAETRVLAALLEGRTIGGAARTLGIGEATVKTHLQHIFDKTDTRRQIDLVRLLSDLGRARVRPVPSPGFDGGSPGDNDRTSVRPRR